LGMCATPQVDPTRRLPDFHDRDWFFAVGDLAVFTPVDRAGYDAIRAEVESERFRYRRADLDFDPSAFAADPEGVNRSIRKAIHGD
ncbi:MAG: allophanate hydrolase, partial [Solirubrobacteraceae bacterium]